MGERWVANVRRKGGKIYEKGKGGREKWKNMNAYRGSVPWLVLSESVWVLGSWEAASWATVSGGSLCGSVSVLAVCTSLVSATERERKKITLHQSLRQTLIPWCIRNVQGFQKKKNLNGRKLKTLSLLLTSFFFFPPRGLGRHNMMSKTACVPISQEYRSTSTLNK